MFKRSRTVAVAAAALLLSAVAGAGTTAPATAAGQVVGSAEWVEVLGLPNATERTITLECRAVAEEAPPGVAVETRIAHPDMGGCVVVQAGEVVASAPRVAARGPRAATAARVTFPAGEFKVCWVVKAVFSDGSDARSRGCQ